jgi:predicted amidohydrolase
VQAEFEETVLYSDIDLTLVEDVRSSILTNEHKRHDVYQIISKI